MKAEFTPLGPGVWINYLSTPNLQAGGTLIGFRGQRYQRGAGIGSFLRSIFRMVVPLAKRAGKSIGREALSAGEQVAKDILAGKTVQDALVEHGRNAAGNLAEKGGKALKKRIQKGEGVGRVKTKCSKAIKGIGRRRNVSRRKKSDLLGLLS